MKCDFRDPAGKEMKEKRYLAPSKEETVYYQEVAHVGKDNRVNL